VLVLAGGAVFCPQPTAARIRIVPEIRRKLIFRFYRKCRNLAECQVGTGATDDERRKISAPGSRLSVRPSVGGQLELEPAERDEENHACHGQRQVAVAAEINTRRDRGRRSSSGPRRPSRPTACSCSWIDSNPADRIAVRPQAHRGVRALC
jgi:hypothetical protein